MIGFTLVIVFSIIGILLFGIEPLLNMDIFALVWAVFIYLLTTVLLLITVKRNKVEDFVSTFKSYHAYRIKKSLLYLLKTSMVIIYILGLFGMLIKGVSQVYFMLLINGLLLAPIGLYLIYTTRMKGD